MENKTQGSNTFGLTATARWKKGWKLEGRRDPRPATRDLRPATCDPRPDFRYLSNVMVLAKTPVSIFAFLLFSLSATAWNADTSNAPARRVRKVNIIISPKVKGFDPAPISFHTQAGIKRLFHRKHLYLIYVDSIKEASARVQKLMQKEEAVIGSLWFDSHGHLGRRLSIIEVGKDEVNHQTIRLDHINKALQEIASYCDSNTMVSLGACYSGATYTLPAVDIFPAQRMNGDSLMIAMGKIFKGTVIYGTESWVMTKPGIFCRSYALAGSPGQRRFKDADFKEVWQQLGKWQAYNTKTGSFEKVNTLALDGKGNIHFKDEDYLDSPRRQKKKERKMKRLKKGRFDRKWYYKYQYPSN